MGNPAKRVLNHNISSNSCCSSKVSCVPNGDNIPNRPSESALPGYVNLGNKSDSSTNNPGTINKDMSAESSFTKDSTKSIAYTSSTSKYSFVMNKKDVSLGSSVTKDSAAHLVNISNTTGVSALTNQGITPESSLTRVCTKSLATAILAGVKKDSTLPGTSLTKDLTENTINTSSASGVTNQLITPESSKDKVCTKSIATGTLTVVKNDSISADRSVIKDLDGTRTVRNDTDFDSPTGDINFERFLSLCAHLTGIPRVSEFARRCYFKANSVFTDSDHFKNLIRNSISEFQSGKNNDSTRLMESVMSALKENKSKKRKTLQAVCDNPEKVRRVQVSTVDCLPSTSKMTEKVANGGGSPPQSEPEDTGAQQTNERVKKKPGRKYTPEEIEVKKKKMVGYLKKLEKAIKSCHQADLGIEDMDMADSAYINEDRLTKKYMEAYSRYCKLENCSEKLGRPTEKSISITTSRFDEINKVVQSHVNKRRKFPDYPQVFFLVKKASKDNNLNLRKTELESIAKEMFEFIGKTKKKRRLEDLSLILGLDSNENSEDPAKKDPELRKQLGENSKLGKERLDAEFQKFTDRGNRTEGHRYHNYNRGKAERK